MGEHLGIVAEGIYRLVALHFPNQQCHSAKRIQLPKVVVKSGGILLMPISADAVYTLLTRLL